MPGRPRADAPIMRHFHKRRPEDGAKYLRDCEAKGQVNHEDVRVITDFNTEYRATHRISHKRSEQYFDKAKNWRNFIGPYCTNTIEDLYKGIARLDEYLFRGKPLKQNTKRDYVIILKIIYRWLIQRGHSAISLEDIERIKTPDWDTNTVSIDDIPTEAEVLALFRACTNDRDRAIFAMIFAMMYEGGFRPGEIAAMKWGDIKWEAERVRVQVKFKTKYTRQVPLVFSMRYLEDWKKKYPFKLTGDNPVFVTRNGFFLSDAVMSKQLRETAKAAGIQRHLTPKTLRHAWATHTRANGCDTETIKEIGWGNRNTKMLAIYDHVGTKAVEQWIDRRAGVIRPEAEKTEQVTARQCRSCGGINAPTDRVCRTCGLSLDENGVVHGNNSIEIDLHQYDRQGVNHERLIPPEGRKSRKISNVHGRTFTVNIKPRHARGFA